MPTSVISSRCILCRFAIQDQEKFNPDTDNGHNNLLFPCHTMCLKIYLTSSTTPSLAKLSQALAPALLIDDPPARTDAIELLKRSCCPKASSFKSTSLCDGEGEGNCRCLKCIFKHLSVLPQELFIEIILLANQSQVQHIVSTLSVVPWLLSELIKSPAREFDISTQGDIFETRIQYGAKTYISSICEREITSSRKIKSKDTTCNYAIVWSDRIGVTKIEFIHAEILTPASKMTCNQGKQKIHMLTNQTREECRNCLRICHDAKNYQDTQWKREWIRAVAIPGEHLFVKSKGVFLKNIANSRDTTRQIFWDCLKPPMLLHQQELENPLLTSLPDNLFLRYVAVHNILAISVAFISGRIIAITSHRQGEQRLSRHQEIDDSAIWMYCPFSKEERLLEVWVVCHKNKELNMGTHALVLRTQQKLVWLSHYISPEMKSEFCILPIANDTLCALYYSDPRLPHSVVGAAPCISSEETEKLHAPQYPTYRVPLPRYLMFQYNMHYSEASLKDLIQVQLCMDAKYCIGVLLHYETCSKVIGQFRYDKEISDFLEPHTFGLAQEQHETNPRVRIHHFDERSTADTKSLFVQLIEGDIAWWYSKNISIVTLLFHDGSYVV